MSTEERTRVFIENTAEEGQGGVWSAPDGFVFLDEIGRGGMGVIFRADDLSLGREVAVKVLQQRFPPDSPTAKRFIDEARVTAQIQGWCVSGDGILARERSSKLRQRHGLCGLRGELGAESCQVR